MFEPGLYARTVPLIGHTCVLIAITISGSTPQLICISVISQPVLMIIRFHVQVSSHYNRQVEINTMIYCIF